MQFYYKKDYSKALVLFKKATSAEPYNAEIHYYLANCHIFLNDGDNAMKEYSLCFDLEPLSSFGQYSRQALLAFGKKFKGFTANSNSGKKRVAPDDPQSVKQALALIKTQTCEREKLHHDRAESAARVAVDAGEERNQRINRAAEELADDLTPKDRAPSAVLQEELHEIQQRAVFEGLRAKLNAQKEATRHMTAAAERSTHIETSAGSLLSLISEKPRVGHVKMKAAGTNLYVRNYDFEPAPPLEPLTASWESLPEVKAATMTPPSDKKNPSKKKPMPKDAANLGRQTWSAAFLPGSSKVLITDINGRILLHVRDDGSK